MLPRLVSKAVSRGLILLLAGGFILLVVASPASSQPSEENGLTVRQAYQLGMTHYDEGKHAKAVEYFKYALERRDHPVLRFNLSQAYSKLGEWKKAVEQGVTVAETGELDEQTATKNQATIVAGRIVLNLQAASRKRKRRATKQRSSHDRSSADDQSSSIPDPHEIAARQEARKERPLSPLGWGGIGTAGAGVGLLAGAVAVDRGLTADFEARSAARKEGRRQRARELSSTIRARQKAGRWLMYGGIGLAAVGAGVLAVDLAGTHETRSGRARAIVAPVGGGLGVATSLDW